MWPDHADRNDVDAMRSAAIDAMISSLERREARTYFVSLVGYYIDGTPYASSGLTVDRESTPDIHRTARGFACRALFPPATLPPETVKVNGTITIQSGGESVVVVPVQLEVRLTDVWGISESIDGAQCDLFQDPHTLATRMGAFDGEPE